MSTAILVDVAFFLKRVRHVFPQLDSTNAEVVGKTLYRMCMDHLDRDEELYRILAYDCAPSEKKTQHPLTREVIDFSKIEGALFRVKLHNCLKKQRKVALRLGHLVGNSWQIKPQATKKLLNRKITIEDLAKKDVAFDLSQKGVDMRIGLDMASLALKRMVRKIILISGDGDFIPAAKLARREGIDVVLDPIWSNYISDGLYEHIDGLKSTAPRPKDIKDSFST